MATVLLDSNTGSAIQTSMSLARKGDLSGARRVVEKALAGGHDLPVLQSLLGMLCCQAGDFTSGIRYLRASLASNPSDIAVQVNLATALIETGAHEDALIICTEQAANGDRSLRLWRFRAYLLQEREDFSGASQAYERVVAGAPDDFEAWNNLGNARSALGDAAGSVDALTRAAAIRTDAAPVRINLAAALIDAGRLEEAEETLRAGARDFPNDAKPLEELAALCKQQNREVDARDALEQAVLRAPDDADLHVKLGTERAAAWSMDGAEAAFRKAMELNPRHAEAHILLALQFEHTNRADEFSEVINSATSAGVDPGSVRFIEALAHRRAKRFEEGLETLQQVPETVEPVRRAQLAGQFHDRLDHVEDAFAAFSEMNRQQSLDPTDPVLRAAEYRSALRADRELVKDDWFANWSPAKAQDAFQPPAFLVGFPRSGTTLLDTMLMGHPDVQVMEERPPLTRVEQELGGIRHLAELNDKDVTSLRALYFEEADKWVERRPDALLVDKFPLHLNKVPIIHRLFPDARFILALRHPCDVVLSCFITNFRLNNAMANFIDLGITAEVYDLSFGFWEQCRRIMPIDVHSVSYERMVEESEAELRPLFDYLGLDWRDEVLDHRQTASERGMISTASYAQVTEPIYKRAAGRWTRYRAQLEPVLPTLKPWVEKLGYTL
jgi:tetratricopeptide (TPR) repeat protein